MKQPKTKRREHFEDDSFPAKRLTTPQKHTIFKEIITLNDGSMKSELVPLFLPMQDIPENMVEITHSYNNHVKIELVQRDASDDSSIVQIHIIHNESDKNHLQVSTSSVHSDESTLTTETVDSAIVNSFLPSEIPTAAIIIDEVKIPSHSQTTIKEVISRLTHPSNLRFKSILETHGKDRTLEILKNLASIHDQNVTWKNIINIFNLYTTDNIFEKNDFAQIVTNINFAIIGISANKINDIIDGAFAKTPEILCVSNSLKEVKLHLYNTLHEALNKAWTTELLEGALDTQLLEFINNPVNTEFIDALEITGEIQTNE